MNKPQCLYSIDNGNSHPHIAKFLKNELIEVSPLEQFDFNNINENSKFIISSVGNKLDLPKHIAPIEIPSLKDQSFLDMKVLYTESLGEDRLHQSYFLYKTLIQNQNPSEKILFVDAGTFTTLDYLSSEGYLGGHIFPGVQTFLNSYHAGKNLPHLKQVIYEAQERSSLMGNSTEAAILNASSLYHQAIIEKALENFPARKIIITGGQAQYHIKLFQTSSLFKILKEEKHLIHYALRYIAEKLKNHL